ncbi:MAG: phosphatase PAP2 family protein [Propionicimonas sp.]|uniref:phosphatase PAP2 family protein n=1 Tax=Propionicimonas sp. TaxID=1955623 RepID=UPI003D09A9D0
MPLDPSPVRARRLPLLRGLAAAATLALLATSGAVPAQAATYSSDSTKPNLVAGLSGYSDLWQSSGTNDLHGTVKNAAELQWNDRLTSWINQHATSDQQFRALQNSAYLASDLSGYDQSISIADGLGKNLGSLYVQGRISGALPLTSALINSSNGTTGAYVSTSTAKATFSYPRPFLNVDPTATKVDGDTDACAPSAVNGSSLASIRKGKSWADASGNLKVTRVAATTDTTKEFATTDVTLDPGYGTAGICTGGAFPSGHTTTAYEAGITLATLLPQLAPQILARASEAGNNRIVLGVHYPLDIIGGRMNGEMALSARWSDEAFRTDVLEPARTELVNYLEQQCGNTLAKCIAADTSYTDNPYGGAKIPGGTSQVVKDRKSAIKVYTERLGYGFAPTTSTRQAASVPAGAENLLLSTFPTLTDAQRSSILAQTEIRSGNPLDTTWASAHGTAPGSWQRLNLATAMSATVKVFRNGKVKVVSTGGQPKLIVLSK